ncbi:MAG: hypothetical protein Q9183_002663 [Haloplaca sp. 2 TL-2023]
MSSGFVSGGTSDKPITRDEEWLKAQEDIEAARRRKEEEGKQEGGKSLYETLQSNKAAKQEAFEESIRLKNQFRTLDEDEVEFLDSVLESTRAKEDAVKKETSEQLSLFRQQQEEADRELIEDRPAEVPTARKSGSPSASSTTESQWGINARKRKRMKDKDADTDIIPGFKLRKSSSTAERPRIDRVDTKAEPISKQQEEYSPTSEKVSKGDPHTEHFEPSPKPEGQPAPISPGPGALGLAAYSSDEDV